MWGDPTKADQQREESDRFTLEEAWNHRLIVRPIEYIPDMPLRDTRGDAIKVNVVDLDDPNGPRLYRGALWFSGPIIKAFKHEIGTPFIGYPTKEPIPNSSYKRWVFVSLAADPDTDAAAQAYVAANPDFMAPIEEKPREVWGGAPSHHEQGPAPEWAGAVPARPAAPARPVAPPRPPAPPVPAQRSAPPAAPQSAPPAPGGAAPLASGSILDRLQRQANQPFPPSAGGETDNVNPPF